MNQMPGKHILSLSTIDCIGAKQIPKKSFASKISFFEKNSALNQGGLNIDVSNTRSSQNMVSKKFSFSSLPIISLLYIHNCDFIEKIQASLNELQIIRERIESKALHEEQFIQQIYKDLKQLEKSISLDLKQIEHQVTKNQKGLFKSTSNKIKTLFTQLKAKLIVTLSNGPEQMKKYLKEEIDVKLSSILQDQQKSRQKEWAYQIDTLSQLTIDLEKEIQQIKNQTKQKFTYFQNQIWKMQMSLQSALDEQKKITQNEHDFILNLITKCAQTIIGL